MQDSKKDFLIHSKSNSKEYDCRKRRDLKKHNWFIFKLKTRLRRAEQAAKMKKKLQIPKKPVVPVCLPLSFYHKYLRQMEFKDKVVSKRNTNKKSRVKNKILRKSQMTKDLPLKQTELSILNDIKIKDDPVIITESDKIDLNKDAELKITQTFEDGVKIQSGNSGSENNIHDFKDSPKIDITKIPLPLQEQLPNEAKVIDEKDLELLRAVKNCNFTVDDIEHFYQITTNNNQHDCQDLNLINLDRNENELNSEQNSVKSNGDIPIDTTPDVIAQPITNHSNKLPLQNITSDIVQVEKKSDQANSLSPETLQRVRVCSNLNKVILGSFYEAAHLERNDTVAMENKLSQLSQVLVDKVYKVFLNYNNTSKFLTPEIIEIDDNDDCEVLPSKSLTMAEATLNENSKINSVEKNQIDAISQKQLEEKVQENVTSVPQLLPIQTSKLPFKTQIKKLPMQTKKRSQRTNIPQKFQIQNATKTPSVLQSTLNLPARSPCGYRNEAKWSRYSLPMQYGCRPFENTVYRAQSHGVFDQRQNQNYEVPILRQNQHRGVPVQRQDQHQSFQNSYPYNYNHGIPHNAERMRSHNRMFELMLQDQNILQMNASSNCRQSYPYNFQKR